jgi:HlyD family secretion protein
VESAQLSLDEANANLVELKQGPTQDDLDDAQSNLDQAALALEVAQAKRDDVYDGADKEEVDLQREQVRQAERSVEQAQENLEKAKITAPFDGTVAELNIELGEEVSTGGQEAAIVLNTPNALRLRLTITESDRPSVEAGQSGFATFDALGDISFPFVIDSVGVSPTTTQGVVTYEAWANVLSAPAAVGATGTAPRGQAILANAAELLGMTEQELQTALQSGQTMAELAEAQGMTAEEFQAALMEQAGGAAAPEASAPEATVTPSASDSGATDASGTSSKPLPGMNASATITVDQVQDVLIVSTQAIQSQGFQSVVEVLKDDGSTEKVVVQTGLSDGTNTEITGGLEEGQTVIVAVRAATSAETTTGTEFQQRGFFQGGEVPQGGPVFTVPGGGGQ